MCIRDRSFPVTVEDANDDGTGFDISFDDITGDGESDVVVTFQHADMSTCLLYTSRCV